jgi:uncharacterized protein
MSERVLIAGGTGAVGRQLTNYLKQKGFEISVLSRSNDSQEGVNTYYWDIEKNRIDIGCYDNVSHVIQLSGANISEKRWSAKRRVEIVNSRVNSTNLLFQSVKDNGVKLKTFISASAVGYYGAVTSEHKYTESDLPGNDFLAGTCVKWEEAAGQFNNIGVKTVKIRTGIVLMRSHGALEKFILPVKLCLGAAFGSGKQYFPWIHIDDLCGIYHKAICDVAINGAINAVSPAESTNKQFVDALCHVLHRPRILPNIPSSVLKFAFGDLAGTLLNGSRISCEKILKSGFVFQFLNLEGGLSHLIKVAK